MDTGIKNIKLSRKILYFANVNGRSLTQGVSLLEDRVNAAVSGFLQAKKKGENQLNISSRSLPFRKLASMCVHAA